MTTYDNYEFHSGETMTRWIQRVRGRRLAHAMSGEVYTIMDLDWRYGEGGVHKVVKARNDSGEFRYFTYWEARQLVET